MADDKYELLAEGYRRGILPPDMKAAFEEAQKRGLFVASQMKSAQRPDAGPTAPANLKLSSEDDLAYRGQFLPLGKTKEGKIVPALPGAFHEAAGMTKRAMEGQPPTAGEALSAASLGLPTSAASKMGTPAAEGVIYRQPMTKPSVPTSAELGAAKSAAYGASEAAGVAVKPDAFREMVQSLASDLKDQLDPGLHPRAAALLQRLAAESGEVVPRTLKQLDIFRQLARGVFKKPADENEQRIAQIVIRKIDDFIAGLDSRQVESGDTSVGVAKLKEARALALQQSKSEVLDDMFERALTKSGEYKASGYENALRHEFKNLANNKAEMGRFSAEEQDAIKTAGRTGNLQQGLIQLGKFSPTSGALGMLVAGGASAEAVLHNPLYAALPIAGLLSKFAATKLRESAAQGAADLVRGGRPISDYRFQQQLRAKARAGQLERMGILGGASALSPQGDFNPLVNPNQF